MQIAYDYGERLNNVTSSLKNDALIKLVSGYPSHGFVIDRKEAGSLFKSVERPDEATIELYQWALGLLPNVPYQESPLVCNLVEMLNSQASEPEQTEGENNETDTANEPRVAEENQGVDEFSEPESHENEQDRAISSQ